MSRVETSIPTVTTSISSANPFYAASDAGFANSNGIVFSSINTNTQASSLKPISNPLSTVIFSNPIPTQIAKPPDTSAQSSNLNHIISFNTNYLQPINLPVIQAQTNPMNTSGFTFAPLLTLPMIPLQTGNMTAQQTNGNGQVFVQQTKPSTTTTTLPPVNQNLSDLPLTLKPLNKCGVTKYTNSRIVGGSITQIGMHTS